MDSSALYALAIEPDLDSFVTACLANPAFPDMDTTGIGTLLHAAIHARRADAALWLMHNGCDVNAAGECAYTPLHMAAVRGMVAVTYELLKLGADVNARDSEGQTPLHKACFNRHHGAVRLLVEAGADINVTDDSGATPLDVLLEDRALANLLMARGAQLSTRPARAAA